MSYFDHDDFDFPREIAPRELRNASIEAVASPNTISNHEDGERLDRALSDLMKEGQRIYDFNERLNHAIEDVVRKKMR